MSGINFSSIKDQHIYKISKDNRSQFSVIFDNFNVPNGLLFCIEIFDIGGRTPINKHIDSYEFFYVLNGNGMCVSEEVSQPISKGDSILIHPGREHEIVNLGKTKLFTLTIMLPDDSLFNTIINGTRELLSPEDIIVLTS